MATKKIKKQTTISKLELGDVFSFQPNGSCFVLTNKYFSNDFFEYFNLEMASNGLYSNRSFCNQDCTVFKKCSIVAKSQIPF